MSDVKNSKVGEISHFHTIESLLAPVISPKNPIEAVSKPLGRLPQDQQDFVIHWLTVIARSNIELAYYFGVFYEQAFTLLPEAARPLWINRSLKLYDTEGLYPAVRFLKDIDGFSKSYQTLSHQITFEEVVGVLTPFIKGLSGRNLKLEAGRKIFTDTETITLPSVISRYKDKNKNRRLYKAMACFLWAQNWFGTFKKNSHRSDSLLKRLESYAKTDINITYQLFLFLEHIRLMACIERELPGLYRQMSLLHPTAEETLKDNTWKIITGLLVDEKATVETTFSALDKVLSLQISLPNIPYLGSLELTDVELNIQERKERTSQELAKMMEQGLLDKSQLEEAVKAIKDAQKQLENPEVQQNSEDFKAELDELLEALSLDVNNMDDEWLDEIQSLVKEGDSYKPPNTLPPALQKQQQEYYYNEWDFERQQYKEAWCRLIEKEVYALKNNFEQQTKEKYHHLLSGIRKAFEVIKDQSTLLRNQTDGEEIDIDAVIRMRAGKMAGEEISDRFYLRKNRNYRSFAVLILVDLSGSTKGWINKIEKESLILITEALEILGDQYAIYGFSGLTRQRCEIYPVKKFTNKNKDITLSKVGGLNAKDYTRMGAAIRHSTTHLNEVEAKHKLLIVLSDGKPDDYDGYKGEYGIHDTRRSIEEAQRHGIRPFAITIDQQAQAYLPQLFGQHRYTILNDVNKLPTKLAEIYRRLTL